MKLSFVIWLLGYPLVCALCRYLGALARQIYRETPPTVNAQGCSDLVDTLIWVSVAILLWFKAV